MSNYSIGDKIVENGRVYEIFKIETQNDKNNSATIYFRPLFDEGTSLIGSIPVNNMDNGEFRAPSTKPEINEILNVLSQRSEARANIDTDEIDEMLKTNRIVKIAKVANILWIDKNNDETTFSPTKRRLFKKALRAVCEEYANAKDTTLEKAESRILTHLNKAA